MGAVALRRQRDAVADGVGAVGEALRDLLDLCPPEAFGGPCGGVLVGRGEHHAGAAEAGDGLGAVAAVEVAQRRDHLDAEHEAAAELAGLGEAGLERRDLVQGRQLVEPIQSGARPAGERQQGVAAFSRSRSPLRLRVVAARVRNRSPPSPGSAGRLRAIQSRTRTRAGVRGFRGRLCCVAWRAR